jgi:hypothetical protein
MRKRTLQILAAITALILASLACSFSASTASIGEVWTARDDAGDDRTSIFNPTDTFYAFVELNNAPDDTKLKAVWTAVDTPVSEPDTLIDEAELEAPSGTHQFSLETDTTWPPGVYKVDIYLEDELAKSLIFEVQGELPQPTPQSALPNIADAFLARDEAGSERTELFTPEDVFYAFIELADAPPETSTRAVWIAVETPLDEPNSVIDEVELVEGSGNHSFYLTSDQLWAPGKYKVDFYVNGNLERTLGFFVQDVAPTVSGARIGDAYMASDAEGELQTNVFSPENIFYAHIELVDAPDDTQIKAVWTAVNAVGEEPNTYLTETDFVHGSGWIYFELSLDEPWPAGAYKVELFINDVFDTMMEFSVQ